MSAESDVMHKPKNYTFCGIKSKIWKYHWEPKNAMIINKEKHVVKSP